MARGAEWKSKLRQAEREDKKQGGIDYSSTAFFLKRPNCQSIYKGPIRLSGRDAHKELISIARDKGLYVWFCSVVIRDGVPYTSGIHLIDWDSLQPETGDEPEPKEPVVDPLSCPMCGRTCSSTSGLTLHMKRNHPTDNKTIAEDRADGLRCPTCGKICSSASGLTLHKKKCTQER